MFAFALAAALSVSQPPPRPQAAQDSALLACRSAGRGGNDDAARAAAESARHHYEDMVRNDPRRLEPKVLLARVISECLIERAPIWSKAGLVKESNRLLVDVLDQDSTHWEARYTLALNYYYAPSFFGWTEKAIAEFERLLAKQGDQALFPEQAKPFLYLGNLYEKKGRHADAVATWQRGHRLFPADTTLRKRVDGGP